MAKIYYGIAGEGRGHATRARALIESIRHEHELILWASADAYDMLEPIYRGTEVRVRQVPCLSFVYDRNRKLAYWKSFFHGFPYFLDVPNQVARIRAHMAVDQPDLVITDFEPLLPRAARDLGVPVLTVDHQQFLIASDLSGLPWRLQAYAAAMWPATKLFVPVQCTRVISSFFKVPLKRRYRQTRSIGVLMRPEILKATVEERDHLVVYLRRSTSDGVLDALARTNLPMKIYGVGERPTFKRLEFEAIHPFKFIEDLATSRALITTAGNQLVGESLFLGKPVLGMPERGNYEQEINAHFLRKSGAGATVGVDELAPNHVHRFLKRIDTYRARIDTHWLCGNDAAYDAVRHELAKASSASVPDLNQQRKRRAGSERFPAHRRPLQPKSSTA